MKWSLEDLSYLKDNYGSHIPIRSLALTLGRSVTSIKHKAVRLRLSRIQIAHNRPPKLDHRNLYDSNYYLRNKNRIYQNKKRRELRYKLDLIDQLGGKCTLCGYNRCPAALDFHHRSEKEANITFLLRRVSKEKLLKEARKCILLCANCHRETHFKGA